jgi:hypothetical protein
MPPFDVTYLLGYDLTIPASAPPAGYDGWEISEDDFAAEAIREETRVRVRAREGTDGRDLGMVFQRKGEWEMLRSYVVNLTKGRLSQSGAFEMPDWAIEHIVNSIRQYAESTEEPRVMLHAHGGLVGEISALAYARDAYQWWLKQGVYPVYFIWETDVFEILKQRLGLARAWVGDVRDFTFEATARAAGGGAIWGDMKESARLACSVDAGGGEAGGARIFAEALARLVESKPAGRTMTVHAVGHSAGAIFHAHLLPVLLGKNLDVESLAYLAPAVRTDLFKERLFDAIGQGRVKSFTMYTMEEEAERDDDLVEPLGITLYGKSLLYLVSRAFEPKRKTPLLGLEEMVGADPEVERLLRAPGRLELSRAKGNEPNPATTARKHGCFDNDAATMASAFRAVTGRLPGLPFPAQSEGCGPDATRALRDLPFIAPAFVAGTPAVASAGPLRRATRGGRRALCVGIDSYRDSPLAGCVRDATIWASALENLGFDVTTVLNGDGTRQRVLDALQALVVGSRSGEVLVFQYAGHGTQAVDLTGDESDRYDEALVPVDYHTGALLLDDDLADVYRRLPLGVVLTLFMDCCHSGTNSRFAPLDRSQARGSERRRFLQLTADLEEAHRRFRDRAGSPAPTSAEESLPGVIHFAACLDNQYAYESDGQGHFTRVATAGLAAAVSRGVTNEDYGSDIATKVIAIGKPQTPRLMRLPAELSGKRLLGIESGEAMVGQPPPSSLALPVSADTRAWDQWCLKFFEAGAAHWRQRLGQ